MKHNLPNIFDYNDFRKYLDEYQKIRYSYDKTFTKSFICKKLGIAKTRSYFGDVLAGKYVSSVYVVRFIKLLDLNKEEAQFFRIMVKYNQSEFDPEERELYFEQLLSLNKTSTNIVDPKIYAYYKNWYNSALRAILNVYDFDCDYKFLAKKIFPPINDNKVKESITLMKELGLIQKNEKGYYKPTQKAISTGDYVKNELIKQYQLKCLELAKNAILKNKKLPQKISTKMISISENGYKRIEERLKRFDEEIRNIVKNDDIPADRVYQLDFMFFPNSR